MLCFDPQTNVMFPRHDEFVAPSDDGRCGIALGFCSRCGEITDRPVCVRLAAQGY